MPTARGAPLHTIRTAEVVEKRALIKLTSRGQSLGEAMYEYFAALVWREARIRRNMEPDSRFGVIHLRRLQ